jgi:enamine deaminase RidA (YjgF/YER057c/UK114 family)
VSVADRLAGLGITLTEVASPIANYVLARESGGLLYLSGHLGARDGEVGLGRVGAEVSRNDAYELARGAAVAMLASAQAALGDLDRVTGVLKLTGFVCGADGFTDHSAVVNGASDLLIEVFGPEAGRHARSAVGVAQLPRGAALEIEAIFSVR